VIWKYDYSRTWGEASEFDGKPSGRSPFRPIRINIWYPARKPRDASPMLYGGYLDQPADDPEFVDLKRKLEEYDLGGKGKGVRGLFNSKSCFDALLKTPTEAFPDAPAAEGRFPLLVYSLGQNDYTQENVVLWEYLASHGYVVATVPHLGTSPRRFHLYIDDQPSYEAQVRDLEFLTTVIRDMPFVDTEKVAAAGHSMGGVYALLLAMRHSTIRAVAGLDSSLTITQSAYAYKYWDSPHYDRARFKRPLLQLYKPGDLTLRLVDGLVYADRYLVKLPSSVHADFTSYPMLTLHTEPAELGPPTL
jgi:pimeloyl-ACP methyl ester carboxylesterase